MKKTNKKLIIALIVFLVISSFSGCSILYNMGTPGPYRGNETALFTIATFSIPGCDQIGTRIEIVEEDSQGRLLYKIWTGNSPLYYSYLGEQSPLVAFVICQHYDDDKVYYYEDDCWVIYSNAESFSITDEKQLKDRNDWDLPLNYDKMTVKTIISEDKQGYKYTANEREIEQGKAKDEFLKQISVDGEEYVFPIILDNDDEGRMLFIVLVEQFKNGEVVDASSVRSYLEIIDTKEHGKKVVIEKIEDPAHIWIQMKDFKKHNGWGGCQRDGSLDNPFAVTQGD